MQESGFNKAFSIISECTGYCICKILLGQYRSLSSFSHTLLWISAICAANPCVKHAKVADAWATSAVATRTTPQAAMRMMASMKKGCSALHHFLRIPYRSDSVAGCVLCACGFKQRNLI